MNDFTEIILLVILGAAVLGTIASVILRDIVGIKKGVNSKERFRVLEILKEVIPAGEKYVPIYAYQEIRHRRPCEYYALGITDDNLYIVPLQIAKKEINYKNGFVIARGNIGKIVCGKPGGSMQFVWLYDKEQNEIIRFVAEKNNTKISRTFPVNIAQAEEYHAFLEKLEEWRKSIPET